MCVCVCVCVRAQVVCLQYVRGYKHCMRIWNVGVQFQNILRPSTTSNRAIRWESLFAVTTQAVALTISQPPEHTRTTPLKRASSSCLSTWSASAAAAERDGGVRSAQERRRCALVTGETEVCARYRRPSGRNLFRRFSHPGIQSDDSANEEND